MSEATRQRSSRARSSKFEVRREEAKVSRQQATGNKQQDRVPQRLGWRTDTEDSTESRELKFAAPSIDNRKSAFGNQVCGTCVLVAKIEKLVGVTTKLQIVPDPVSVK